MSQQQMNFDADNRDGPPSYETGYQEATHDKDFTSHLPGQKLSWQDAPMQPTAGQRLALAMVSLLILFLFFLALIVLLTTSTLASNVAQNFAPAFGYMSLGLLAAVIVVNVLFNRKH
ncbi:MAG TPA: hypothetical protein VGT44_07840 [Ktedonobacteraceae bacterium]|nr:hypothetical protein [Ktedonobacteraceae bacterium]